MDSGGVSFGVGVPRYHRRSTELARFPLMNNAAILVPCKNNTPPNLKSLQLTSD